jgi:peroxiredoxin (alkyl hydroperoxide reductase subunit C)
LSKTQDKIDEFHRLGAEVYGVSVDSHHAQRVWAEQLELTFPLLGDLDRSVMTAFDVKVDVMGNYHGVSRRALFIIDREQRIAYQEIVTERGKIPDIDAALDKLREMAEQ